MYTLIRTVVTWISALILIGLTGGAGANEIGRSHWSMSNNALTLEGEILPQSPRQFHRLFSSALLSTPYPEPVRIELDSPGGDLKAALRIVRIINSAQLQKTTVAVTVGSGKRCFSTCLILLAAGDRREAASDALLRFPGSEKSSRTVRILSGIANVDPDLANYLLKTSRPAKARMAYQLDPVFSDFVRLIVD